ncbi:hypothetical protein [Streptomyces sp. NPDC049040]|uniref:hypothetical protein n=1 Tax=Streptomyces sp. NPDC049040 TaxID=3365593 RepID=UPI003712FF77
MHYFVNDGGRWMSIGVDIDVLGIGPDGYREVGEDEFNEAAGIVVMTPDRRRNAVTSGFQRSVQDRSRA